MAFAASYFSLIALFFVPIFIFIWVYFPMIGLEHGRSVAESRIEHYKDNLCGDKGDYWSECVTFSTAHIKLYEAPAIIEGRLMFRSGSLLGVYTENGPVVLSMPKSYFHATSKNNCYKGCPVERITNQSSSPAKKRGPDA